MEWVETTAATVEQAKDALLDQLGVHDDEAEFEVLEEPRVGFMGRVKGVARVRARVMPKAPRPKEDRRRRRGKSDRTESPSTSPAPTSARAPKPPAERVVEAPVAESRQRLGTDVAAAEATTFLSSLVDKMGMTDAAVRVEVTDDGDLEARIEGSGLGLAIGQRGAMVRALEELVRTRLQHVADGGSTPKLRLDVGDYRGIRRSTILAVTDEVIEEVRSSGTPHALDVVLAGERKVVHDRVGEVASDLMTRSEGEDPQRRVVILPSS